MSGHLLLFGSDIVKPTAAIGPGPVGEIRFPTGVITYRDLADLDDLINAAVELRAMLGDAQAHADAVETVAAELAPVDDGWAAPPLDQPCDHEYTPNEAGTHEWCQKCDSVRPLDEALPERVPQATVANWQAAVEEALNPDALKREAPLESLAPEEDEVQT